MKKKLLLTSLLVAGTGFAIASDYFFKMAMTPFNKKPDSKKLSGKDSLYRNKVWFRDFPKEKWSLETKSGLTLFAQYLNHDSDKTAILLHGFMSDSDSMGGATTMMVSGMKLPSQVKAFIEDCGYSSVKEEIMYQAGNLCNLNKIARMPLVEAVSGINKVKNGFFLGQASSVEQLKKNTRPFLFIHGGKDHFVPTEMVYQNYAATDAPKEIWIAPLAGHALSYPMYKKEYQKTVKAFLDKYKL